MHIFVSWGIFRFLLWLKEKRKLFKRSGFTVCYNKVNVRVSRPGKFASAAVTRSMELYQNVWIDVMKTLKCCRNKLKSCHELFYLVLLLNKPLTGNLFIKRTLRNWLDFFEFSYFVYVTCDNLYCWGKKLISVFSGQNASISCCRFFWRLKYRSHWRAMI